MPAALDYANNQIFQGSMLEEWLMQTLDEHIHSAAYINQSFVNKQAIHPIKTPLIQPVNENSDHPIGIGNPSSATTSATSLVVESSNVVNESTNEGLECVSGQTRRLNSDSTHNNKPNIDEIDTNSLALNLAGSRNSSIMLMQPASPSSFKSSYSPKSTTTAATTATTGGNNSSNQTVATPSNLNVPSSTSQQQQSQQQAENFQFNLLYKRQEANFYVQQILTDLLAIGVLEYESGFDNAINRTYKVVFLDIYI